MFKAYLAVGTTKNSCSLYANAKFRNFSYFFQLALMAFSQFRRDPSAPLWSQSRHIAPMAAGSVPILFFERFVGHQQVDDAFPDGDCEGNEGPAEQKVK